VKYKQSAGKFLELKGEEKNHFWLSKSIRKELLAYSIQALYLFSKLVNNLA
jgi:hypothetical protein